MKTEDIDKMIGMPDIDHEWAQFEKEVINQQRPRRWAVAASIAIIFCLGATAAGVWLAFSGISESSEIPEKTAPKPDFFIFDNVEMEKVAATLARYFRLTPVFENETVKHKRIYMKVDKKKTIEEVVEQLNELDEFTVSVSEGKLIIK